MDKFLKKNILISLALSVMISLMTLGLLLHFANQQIKGDYYWMLWPTAKYGIPADLQKQFDLKPLWKTHGWDGQFYYYMANDLLIQKNYQTNMDGTAYRYQRIGLPFVAKAVASLLGQRFVSAKFYFFTHFIIYFLGLWLLIFIFIQKNKSGGSASCGPQVHLGSPRTQGTGVMNGPLFSFFEFSLLAIKNLNFTDMIGQLCYISTIIFCFKASISLTRSRFQKLFFYSLYPLY